MSLRDLVLGAGVPQLLKYSRCSRFSITSLTEPFEAGEEALDVELPEGELFTEPAGCFMALGSDGEDSWDLTLKAASGDLIGVVTIEHISEVVQDVEKSVTNLPSCLGECFTIS